MNGFRLDRFLQLLTSVEPVAGLLWIGLAALTVALVMLMQTRWGRSKLLRKCVILSLLAHVLLAGYSTTVRVITPGPPVEEPFAQVSFVDGPVQPPASATSAAEERPWEVLPHDAVQPPTPADVQREPPMPLPEPQRQVRPARTNLPGEPALDDLELAQVEPPRPVPAAISGAMGRSTPGKSTAEEIEAPAAERRQTVPVTMPDRSDAARRPQLTAEQPGPSRTTTNGVPAALIEQPYPLPRLANPTPVPDSANSLAGLTDSASHSNPSRPAQVESVDAAYDAAGATDNAAPAREGLPGSIASQGPRQPAGGEEPGLPSADTAVATLPQLPRSLPGEGGSSLPSIYRLRTAPDRSRLAERQGATSATEQAVAAALKWLADNQEADGRWDAAKFGAGEERLVLGRSREKAGLRADTGVSGLALLAFLASGHTHREGPYRENVRRGLEFLLASQAADGNLGGQATPYAKMYCHGIATFAISEAYGMTADSRLRQPIQNAVNYTIAAQDPSTGGWRYKPADPGDTSQCGWQLMALKSAELAGIPMPVASRNGVIRYLRTVSSGQHGGLASYRPGERISRPMTAEALVCWQFLGIPREHPAGNEAGEYLLGELPGEGEANLYYWYYGTLGMYQLQGKYWQRWNAALRTTLLARQRDDGPLAGSWDTDTIWGGYGGRVYTTALSTLCLEVYYRFLPLYVNAAPGPSQPRPVEK